MHFLKNTIMHTIWKSKFSALSNCNSQTIHFLRFSLKSHFLSTKSKYQTHTINSFRRPLTIKYCKAPIYITGTNWTMLVQTRGANVDVVTINIRIMRLLIGIIESLVPMVCHNYFSLPMFYKLIPQVKFC
jgi:hypothetical protein